jgi:AcrR family transcriptional regulator
LIDGVVMNAPRRPGDATRVAIIDAALRAFGERGYDGASTRAIAADAATNVASISYHFGGKEGLRNACAQHVAAQLAQVMDVASPPPRDPAAARATLAATLRGLCLFLLLRPQAGLIAAFMVREMARPSPALDLIYDGAFEGIHRRLCVLWANATGLDAESQCVRLAVFSMLGQILYFHLARPVVRRRMEWSAVEAPEAEAIAATIDRTLHARLDADAEALP